MDKLTSTFSRFFKASIAITPRFKKAMFLAGIIYLVFPYLLFYGLFVKPIFAVICILGCLTAIFFTFKESPANDFGETIKIPIITVIITIIILTGLLTATGLGGVMGRQASDLDRTNGILNDYLTYGLPTPYYKADGSLWGYLTYYNALYTPSIIIGNLTGSFHAAEVTMLLYSIIGLVIGVFWLYLVTRRARLKTLFLFLFFSGMDSIGYFIVQGQFITPFKHLDLWANVTGEEFGHIANYHSMGTAMRYSVQHYIPAFIVCFMLYYMFTQTKNYKTAILLAASLCLWSPFVAISVVPFAVAVFIFEKCNFKKFFGGSAIFSILFIGLPMIIYFLSMPANEVQGTADGIRGLGWVVYNWPILLLFIALEFDILCWFLYKGGTVNTPEKRLLFFVSVGVLIGGLFFDFGSCHDFSMRLAIIPWFMSFVMIPEATEKSSSPYRGLLIACLLIGAISCFTEYATMVAGLNDYGTNAYHAVLPTGSHTLVGWDLQ
ncbi:MAG: hypothetical protein PHG02_06890 [Oscillospiraceae bacterium]|nr:hypothetical protein [Oscillospiraceae bacterium]